ncbi:MAG: hypothetical protein KQH63_06990 [Desulfobulbaceae bacterium]|nr:hypothetical protein [Desulfobulbaceae bacterium]
MTKEEDDYKICIWGTTVSKHEAHKIWIMLLVGLIGALVSAMIFGKQNKLIVFIISFILAVIGYFGVVNKVFKKKDLQ